MFRALDMLLFNVVFVLLSFYSSLAWGPFWVQCCTCPLVLLFSCFLVCVLSCSLVNRCSCPLVLLHLLVFSTRPLHGARLVHRFSCPLSLSLVLVPCMGPVLGEMLHSGGSANWLQNTSYVVYPWSFIIFCIRSVFCSLIILIVLLSSLGLRFSVFLAPQLALFSCPRVLLYLLVCSFIFLLFGSLFSCFCLCRFVLIVFLLVVIVSSCPLFLLSPCSPVRVFSCSRVRH